MKSGKEKPHRRRTVYASLYSILDQEKLKAHMIVIVGRDGELEDYVPGPFTIGDWYLSRIRKKEASQIVWYFLKDTFPRMKVDPEDIKLWPVKKTNELLFRLQNK
jgi:hypothetical protein